MLVTHLAVFSIFDILLSVEEPVWDFVLARILHDGHHTLNLETEDTLHQMFQLVPSGSRGCQGRPYS